MIMGNEEREIFLGTTSYSYEIMYFGDIERAAREVQYDYLSSNIIFMEDMNELRS